jgi:uncharacterized membrane protein
MTEPAPQHTPSTPSRTIRRIVAEAFFVAFLGAFVFGLGQELEFRQVGIIGAAIIWIIGTPALEIARLMQSKR